MKLHLPAVEQSTTYVDSWCHWGELLTSLDVVGMVACSGAIMLLMVGEIQTAIEACQTERDCVVAERDAFQRFQTRIQRIDPVRVEQSDTSATDLSNRPQAINAPTDPGDATLTHVLSAYEDTVRSVPHYDAGYEETRTESLIAELGEDIVTALAANKNLMPAVKEAIVDRSQVAIDTRTELVDAITDEINALHEYQTKLDTIETRRHNLLLHLDNVYTHRGEAAFDIWCVLEEFEDELDEIAGRRQAEIHSPSVAEAPSDKMPVEPIEFYKYLYSESEASQYPVLSVIGNLGTTIRADKSQIRADLG